MTGEGYFRISLYPGSEIKIKKDGKAAGNSSWNNRFSDEWEMLVL
jgi:hypothetical protein